MKKHSNYPPRKILYRQNDCGSKVKAGWIVEANPPPF